MRRRSPKQMHARPAPSVRAARGPAPLLSAILAACCVAVPCLAGSALAEAAAPGGPGGVCRPLPPGWPRDRERLWVREIIIEREAIFARGEPARDRFYGRLANALHVTTRERVIRDGLFFHEGDTVTVADVQASVRRLRSYPFIHPNVVVSVAARRDTADIRIQTRDVWTTMLDLSVGKEGGLWTWSFSLREANLGGFGKEMGLAVGHDEEQLFWGVGYGDRQFLGREIILAVNVTRGDDLAIESLSLQRPFDRPTTPFGFGFGVRAFDGRRIDRRGGIDGPEWRQDALRLRAVAGPRLAGSARVALRVLPSFYLQRERYSPWDPDSVGAALRDRDIRAIGVTLDFVHERFSERLRIDRLADPEDFNLGSSWQLLLGYTSPRWGSQREGLHARLQVQEGLFGRERHFLLANLEGHGDYVAGSWRDASAALYVRYYANLTRRQTLALHLRTDWTIDLAPQDLPTLGAHRGLRGFDAYRFWGERLLFGSLEDRLVFGEDLFGLVTVGGALFLDAGTTWMNGEATRARPRVAGGVGLRLQASRASGGPLTRFDLGHPLVGGEEGDGWILSFSAGQAF